MLTFDVTEDTGKTRKYNVRTDTNPSLGQIKWYAPWRRYCFFPNMYTLFDVSCLQEIVDEIKKLMDYRKMNPNVQLDR